MNKEKFAFMLSKDVMEEFNEHCLNNAFNPSAKVELLLKKEVFMAKRKQNRESKMWKLLKELADAKGPIRKTPQKLVKEVVQVASPKASFTNRVPSIWELMDQAKKRNKI